MKIFYRVSYEVEKNCIFCIFVFFAFKCLFYRFLKRIQPPRTPKYIIIQFCIFCILTKKREREGKKYFCKNLLFNCKCRFFVKLFFTLRKKYYIDKIVNAYDQKKQHDY